MTETSTLAPGDIVLVDFPGITGIKRRPALVLSTSSYHACRPDAILGIITSKIADATSPMNYVLSDWKEAGLHVESAFRTFLVTLPQASAHKIGQITSRDMKAIQVCLHRSIEL